MKKLIILIASFVMLITTTAVTAGEIVDNAVITAVANTVSNNDIFNITVSGGSGHCVDSVIKFPASSTNDAVYKRAYASAMAALMSGNKVRVFNYTDNTCDTASFIQVYNN